MPRLIFSKREWQDGKADRAANVAGDVAAAIIRKPFDRDGQAIDLAEPVLDGSHHQVAHVLARDAAGGVQEAHGFPITAVERKRNPHPLAVVAADLKAVGAPTPITFIHAMRPSWRRSSPPTWRSSSRP